MKGNIFKVEDKEYKEEEFETLLQYECLVLERIISTGQTTPEGEWYDADRDEWVLLLQGKGILQFEDGERVVMEPGDYILIKAHRRHKVVYTDLENKTIWLTLYYKNTKK